MRQKLNCVLLIDDDEPTNFLHKITVMDSGYAEKVVAVENGLEALQYLKTATEGKLPQPDLIFLDINMPGMNGWDFLEEYNRLGSEVQGKVVVVMLTTSLNPDDEERAKSIGAVFSFMSKPLTIEMLEEVIDKEFPGLR